MRSHICFLLFTLVMLSCNVEPHTTLPEKTTLDQPLLTTLESIDQNGVLSKEEYFYDELRRLKEIYRDNDKTRLLIRRPSPDSVIILRQTGTAGEVTQKTYYQLDQNRNPKGIREYEKNGSGDFVIRCRWQCQYDNDDLSRVEFFLQEKITPVYSWEYEWVDGKVSKMSYLDQANQVSAEILLEYDDHPSYMTAKEMSWIGFIQPHHTRNPLHSELIDYTGRIDPDCVICEWTYEYNEEGYPIRQVKSTGVEQRMYYDR